MELYIRIKDGQPIDHPILGDNLRDALQIDTNNLPSEFAPFVRRENNVVIKPYEVVEVRYEWDGPVVQDVFYVRNMTDEEKAAFREEMYNIPHPDDYVFDETLVRWVLNRDLPGSEPDVIA
jgi:hypothetical protein